ncbi:GNAT family N-acetyltransferase [Bacillus sp. HMF5848]|uniref:GNAT family N-acetyltransferase n=1 Tax=Bacillus sp. HMF5848 TaxID=2495421 RepID=UPI000F78DD48|nr:GNAT family N-acetyltransferase [Bacillus sp. HMF5848]RSK25989.1 GNAT family N-acetyltransferase [Bacillus sp. HMF5848]
MKYIRVTSIEDPLFKKMHDLMKEVFPPEEVLAFDLWKGPLEDPSIRVFVVVDKNQVVGTTEYRYYPDWSIAMTDFTIIGRHGMGIGPFIVEKRNEDLQALSNGELSGMFAEIYDPYRVKDHEFGGVKTMDPFVRREVLSHLGYKRLDFSYVHPSWHNDGEAVSGLDLCFMPTDNKTELPAELIVKFLTTYYSVLSEKPAEWIEMIENLKEKQTVELLPL